MLLIVETIHPTSTVLAIFQGTNTAATILQSWGMASLPSMQKAVSSEKKIDWAEEL